MMPADFVQCGAVLGERIRRLRNERGLSQQELALACHLSQQSIAAYEQDVVKQPRGTVRLAEFFGVTLDYLLREERKSYCQPSSP